MLDIVKIGGYRAIDGIAQNEDQFGAGAERMDSIGYFRLSQITRSFDPANHSLGSRVRIEDALLAAMFIVRAFETGDFFDGHLHRGVLPKAIMDEGGGRLLGPDYDEVQGH